MAHRWGKQYRYTSIEMLTAKRKQTTSREVAIEISSAAHCHHEALRSPGSWVLFGAMYESSV
jgi:hypothetical protein